MSKTLHYSEGIVTKQNIFENLNAVNPETNELKNPPKSAVKKLKPKRKKKTTRANKENSADNSDVKEEEDTNDVTGECSGEETVKAEEKQKEEEEEEVEGGEEKRKEECGDIPNPSPANETELPTPEEPTSNPPIDPSDTTPTLSNDSPSHHQHPNGETTPPISLTELDSTSNPSENQSDPSQTIQAPPPSETTLSQPSTIRYGYPTIQFVNSSFKRGGRGGGGRGGGGAGERREESGSRPGRNDSSSHRPYDSTSRPSNSRPGPYPSRPYPNNPSKPIDRENRTYPTNPSKPNERENRTYPTNPSKPNERENRTYPTNHSNPASRLPTDRDKRTYPANPSYLANPSKPIDRDSKTNPSSKPIERDNRPANPSNPANRQQSDRDRPSRPARSGKPARDAPASNNNNQPNKPPSDQQQPNEKPTTANDGDQNKSSGGNQNPPNATNTAENKSATGGNGEQLSSSSKGQEKRKRSRKYRGAVAKEAPGAGALSGESKDVPVRGDKETLTTQENTGGKDRAQSGRPLKDVVGAEVNNGKQSTPGTANGKSTACSDGTTTTDQAQQNNKESTGGARNSNGTTGSNTKSNGSTVGKKPSGEVGNRMVTDRSNKSSMEKEGPPTHPASEQFRGKLEEHTRLRGGERQRYGREERDRDGRPRGEERPRGYSGQNRGYNDRYPDERRGGYRRSFASETNRHDNTSMGPPLAPPPRQGGRNSSYRSSTRTQRRDSEGVSGSHNERPPRSQSDYHQAANASGSQHERQPSRSSGQQNGYVSSSDDQHLVNGDTSLSNQQRSSRNKRRPYSRRVHTKPEVTTTHSVDGTEYPRREPIAQSDSRSQSENIVMNGGARVEGGGEVVDNTRDKDGKTKKWSDESWADDAPRKPSPYEEQTNRVKVTHEPVSIPNSVPYNQTVEEVQGDLMAAPVEYSLAIAVSEDFRMPSGTPALFRNEFRQLDILLDQQARVGEVACLQVKPSAPRHVLYLVTKKLAQQKPVLKTLRLCLETLRKECTRRGVRCLAMPQLGSGPDRLNWRDVKPLIEQAFDGSNIQVLVYMQNEDQEFDSKSSKVKLTGAKLTIEPKPVVDIEEWTSIIVLTSVDGTYNGQQIHALHNKFDVLDDLEAQLPGVSVGSVISLKRSNYFLNFFIVTPSTPSTPFKFESISRCLQVYKKHLNKDYIEYVAFEVLPDRNAPNELLNEKLISFMKNSLPFNISLHVCWPEHIEDRYFLARTKPMTNTTSSSGNVHQSPRTPRIESYLGNAAPPRYHSNASSHHQGFHSNYQAASSNNNNTRLIQIDSNRDFPKL